MINPRRVIAIARKEALHVLRDWRSLVLALAIPVMLILLFGYALNLDVDDVPTIVWDQSRTPQSREFISMLDGSPYFKIRHYFDSYRQLELEIDGGRALAAVVIPADFARQVAGRHDTSIQVVIDGSDANTARLVLGYFEGLGALYSLERNAELMSVRGLDTFGAPVAAEPRAWYNPDLQSSNNIVPGLIAVVMIVIAALLTSTTIAREWELGTMEQLISTPVRGPELILGKLIPYFAIGFADVLIATGMARYVFAVPFNGNAGLLFAMASVFLTGALCMGMMLSITLKKQVIATQIALVGTYMPTLLLSGFVFAIPNMPKIIQFLTYAVPARYFIAILRGIYLKGIGLEILWVNALLLVIWAAVIFVAANRRLRLKLE